MRERCLEILELKEGASQAEIKRAYRRLSKKYHPDISTDPNATDKFIAVDKAYDYLTNESKSFDYSYTNAKQSYSPPTEDPKEQWRREARARQKWKAEEKARYQYELIQKLNDFSRYFIIPLFVFNLVLFVDWILPKEKEEQAIISTSQVFERSRRSKFYSHDRIQFEHAKILVEKGTWSEIKEARKGTIITTSILNLPRYCEIEVAGVLKTYTHLLGVYDTFGFLIPLVLILSYFFLYGKWSANSKLSISCILFFIVFFQGYLFLST